MCGIFGIIANTGNKQINDNYSKIIKSLFLLSESRGKEASGFAVLDNENIYVYKAPFPASDLVKSQTFKKTFAGKAKNNGLRLTFGHSRLVTNGYEHFNKNNQPVIKNGIVAVHNGIIVNQKSLWEKYTIVKKETDLDSELIPAIVRINLDNNETLSLSLQNLFGDIYGMTSAVIMPVDYSNIILATNNGSLYCIFSKKEKTIIFASEYYILKKLIYKNKLENIFDETKITQIEPCNAISINYDEITVSKINFAKKETFSNEKKRHKNLEIKEIFGEKEQKNVYINKSLEHSSFTVPILFEVSYQENKEKINKLNRCSKCLLPETFPFIDYDEDGVCNYCRNYKKTVYKGISEFEKLVSKYRKKDNSPECLIPFSGGRDSSYSLHYVKKVLGMKPIAYSYDWGMLTDLARRNQSRMCGKLGVEHILISADIRKKRENIRKNVLAWLKRPNLGTIPLFMAGDKQYFYFAQLLKNQNNLKLVIMGENHLEKTLFKSAFSGAKQKISGSMAYHISTSNKLRMLMFYVKEYILNPSYINSSLADTFGAFFSYYGIKHDYENLFNYIRWDEKLINDTLINEYDWETDPGTKTTWRIGDGTAAFYNYIYYTVAGFSENDTFRSNQIREGDLTREEALKHSIEENMPRWDSVKWYCDTIGIKFDKTIERINSISKAY